MVTIQELVANITDDAQRQAQQIDAQTQEQLMRYEQETETILTAERERRFAAANKQREELLMKMQAKQQLELMQATLRTKQELIDQAFAQARHELSKKSAARSALLENLLDRANKQISIGSVIVASQDANLFKNKKLSVDVSTGLGGFIAQSIDGRVRVDLRFETLLDDIRTHKTAEITTVLFADKHIPSVKPVIVKSRILKKSKKVRR